MAKKPRAALLFDLANLSGALEQDRQLNPRGTIKQLYAAVEAEFIGLWCFADFASTQFSQELQCNLVSAGFTLIHCPRFETGQMGGKASDDTQLLDMGYWLISNGRLQKLIIASGDKDFLSLAKAAQAKGIEVILATTGKSVSRYMASAVDSHLAGVIATEAASDSYRVQYTRFTEILDRLYSCRNYRQFEAIIAALVAEGHEYDFKSLVMNAYQEVDKAGYPGKSIAELKLSTITAKAFSLVPQDCEFWVHGEHAAIALKNSLIANRIFHERKVGNPGTLVYNSMNTFRKVFLEYQEVEGLTT